MYDSGIRCFHRDTECGIYSNSLLTLLLFCKLQTILKLKHILISTRNKQGMKNQLLTLRFPGSFISELQRGDREKMETWDTERAPGSPLLQSLPKPLACPQSCSESTFTPSLDQGSHLCLTQTTMHALPSLYRTGEESVVVPPCGHRADDWTPELPFDLLTRDLPSLSLGFQQWVSAVHTSWCPSSVKFKAWIVTQNTCWHGHFSPH